MMTDGKEQPSGSGSTVHRPWRAWVGFPESWLGFAPHHERSGELDVVRYQEPTWAMRRAIVEAVLNRNPRAVAHI